MKLSLAISGFLPVFAAGAFLGADEQFMSSIANGDVPEGVLPALLSDEMHNLRKLEEDEPQKAGERCGRRNPCEDGNECVASDFGNFCMPKNCIQTATQEFIDEEELNDYPEKIMAITGYKGKNALNVTEAQQGWSAVIENSDYMINREFQKSVVSTMSANPPNMTKLLDNVLRKCPAAASEGGITLMLGMHYELAALLPKFMNSYYFAIGTGDIDVTVDGEADTTTGDLDIEYEFEAKGGIYSDVCGGVGPDVGFDLGLTFGAAFTGTVDDLVDCSFAFDLDAGLVTSFGASVMVTSTRCVTKLMFTSGWGLGGGIGFSGCRTYELSRLDLA